ncbi:DsbA family protein [Bdellovibrio sp. HCB209]|uniref:vitamin K epoxide reductase/DsbA family protein n=1 Tax=Bdellovibrio sp. HCB209 TaxID=3394354 RepID=UPI0039B6B74A
MKNTSRKNLFLTIAVIATLIAVGVHAYLFQHFYVVKFGTDPGASVCNINETFNCDTVASSTFAQFLGIPVAMWGLATNLILLFLLCVTRWNLTQDRDKTGRYAFLMSSVVLLGSLVMGAISFTAMTTYCLFCMAAYVLSILTFIGAWQGANDLSISNLTEDIKDTFVSERWVLGSLIAIPVIAFVVNLMYTEQNGFNDIERRSTEVVSSWTVFPEQKFDLTKGLIKQKGSDAPVMTIVEFADFFCPHCKHAAPPIHAFIESHPDVKLVFKPFPLDGTCNKAVNFKDGIRCGLATSVMCAEKIAQKGWTAHDYIFDKQNELMGMQNLDKSIEQVATATGISLDDLKNCLKDPATTQLVSEMAKEGEDAQISGTPTVFVNGKLLPNGQQKLNLEAVYKSIKK